jgi:Gnt-I system high-affinity gluconate transporter
VFTIVRENKLPLLWVGLPMSIALSTMHSFLPPHPGPAAVSGTFHASMALTLVYGLVIAIPAAALIAFTWPRLSFVKRMNPTVPRGLIAEEDFPERELPSFATCLGLVLIPIVLMGALATAEIFLPEDSPVLYFLNFFGEAPSPCSSRCWSRPSYSARRWPAWSGAARPPTRSSPPPQRHR